KVLDISRVDTRHSGIFLCKAETVNPTWAPQNAEYDTRLYESGVVTAPFLVQIQAIRGIVYSRPRLLPGSPMEIFAPTDPDESQLVSPYKHFVNKRQDEQRLNTVQNSPNYLQTVLPLWRDNDNENEKLNMAHKKKIVQEGGKLILECQARGRPSPQLLWYKGGMGSSTTHNSQAVTFDQRIKSALQHLPLDDVQRELGILIADFEHLFPSVINMENISSEVIGQPSANHGAIYRKGIQTHELGRFQLSTGVRKDDRGDPVIAMSRLTINNLMPPDATRYTCLALLNLNHYGGVGNFTDVGSILPDVVLRPRFVHSGTHLKASGYPGESCRLTCEAYGGLPTEMGLRVRLLKGPGVNKLISHASYSLYSENNNRIINSYEAISEPQSIYNNPSDLWNGMNYESNNSDFIVIVKPGMNPRYHLNVEPDPRNPYATILRLDITDLTPEDNSFYLCEALSGPHWRAITPTSSEPPGRVTVWFAPPAAEPRRVGEISDQLETDESEASSQPGKYVVYGLSHFPSKIACQALGQPTPQWKWVGPQNYQDGEYSVTELTVPAGYWNVGVFGTYSCTASNKLGHATGHVRLQLASHPGRPTLKACKTGGLPLTHYELRIQTHPRGAFHGPFAYLPGRRVLRLPNLIPGYYYRFALSAVSRAGRGPNAYLQVTTNRLSKPVIKLLASQDYISPTGYNVHWNTEATNGMDINQYNINIRPVEVDYSLGSLADVNKTIKLEAHQDKFPVSTFLVVNFNRLNNFQYILLSSFFKINICIQLMN
ncbi:cell adhesion molecule, partial [Schistosoma japonicum]